MAILMVLTVPEPPRGVTEDAIQVTLTPKMKLSKRQLKFHELCATSLTMSCYALSWHLAYCDHITCSDAACVRWS